MQIENFFDFRWKNDVNLAISSEEDIKLLSELPDEVIIKILRTYLFSRFLESFRKFLTFVKTNEYITLNDNATTDGFSLNIP